MNDVINDLNQLFVFKHGIEAYVRRTMICLPSDIWKLILSNVTYIQDIITLLRVSKEIQALTREAVKIIISRYFQDEHVGWSVQFKNLEYCHNINMSIVSRTWSMQLIHSNIGSIDLLDKMEPYATYFREILRNDKDLLLQTIRVIHWSTVIDIILHPDNNHALDVRFNYNNQTAPRGVIIIISKICDKLSRLGFTIKVLRIGIQKSSINEENCYYLTKHFTNNYKQIETLIVYTDEFLLATSFLHPELKNFRTMDGMRKRLPNMYRIINSNCPKLEHSDITQ